MNWWHCFVASSKSFSLPILAIFIFIYSWGTSKFFWSLSSSRVAHTMSLEFDVLLRNHTWVLVPPSPSYNLLGLQWVLKTKWRVDGSLERRKAWLVAQGFHQQPSLDYFETFSLVVKSVTIHTVLSLAVSNQWPLHQLDIQNDFLHDNLEDDVYMK